MKGIGSRVKSRAPSCLNVASAALSKSTTDEQMPKDGTPYQ